MVPVSLRLNNFLSYGTAAGELDFQHIAVACLSGGNGQGKSALLDAMTWAIWGEARKSSGAQKPDEELLRVGAREMEVEFVFDVEGTRYRIRRSYYRTASGKTTKPGLEFQVYDPDAGDYKPLTADNVRATQAEIERRVGLDYATFINASFLLQGRSDEFTRKKPTERKEILGRILGLERYDRLALAASQHYADAKERTDRLQADIERLTLAVEGEAGWKQEHEETKALCERLSQELADLRREERGLAERLQALDHAARQADAHRDALRRLAERREGLDVEEATLRASVADAEALVARAAEIEADYERHQRLDAERVALDEKADLKRGLDAQRQQVLLELERLKNDLEVRLARHEADLQATRRRLDDLDASLRELPALRTKHERAAAAEQEFVVLKAKHEARRRLVERMDQLTKQLDGEANQLRGRLNTLRLQLQQADEAPAPDSLRAKLAELAQEVEVVTALRAELETVQEAGTAHKARLDALTHERERLMKDVEAIEARRARLHEVDEETCPTCGTPLTDDHRHTVDATYARERVAIEERLSALEAEATRHETERAALREHYKMLRVRLDAKNGVVEERARAEALLRQREEGLQRHEALAKECAQLERVLEGETFGLERRAELTRLHDQLASEPFDEARFEQVRVEAAQRAHWEGELRRLEAYAAERESVAARIRRLEEQAREVREDLAQHRTLAPARQKLDALDRQLATVGYDGARHEAVRQALAALAEAPRTYLRLAEAQRNLGEWARRLDRLATERAGMLEEEKMNTASLAAIEATIAERPALAAARDERVTAVAAAEQRLHETRSRLGGLVERLERCAQDRATLKRIKEEHREAKQQQAIYRHLRTAFGKHGIPSLIIEEALPEIQDRANTLLDRLSGGRTRVILETLKDKKTGGTKETLDIKITDESGSARAYETFSGGEAFRINFALRIALSQLLAERAGVRVRTLVIDEGFGTQDREGVQNLVQSIHAIQNDFDKILVITHLDELKDAFPVRIEVTKKPVEGSTFEVLGV
ncbi:MAG TPA: SMC family ATPase [Rubricoccaceae bacterium]|nr:SMC family ATPase [Rubricoccaceae bacterium]